MKPSEYFVNFNIKFIMAHWKYVRPKTRVMRKCTFLLIIASITQMEQHKFLASIIGSSNLSYQGLQGRTEINVRFYRQGEIYGGKTNL